MLASCSSLFAIQTSFQVGLSRNGRIKWEIKLIGMKGGVSQFRGASSSLSDAASSSLRLLLATVLLLMADDNGGISRQKAMCRQSTREEGILSETSIKTCSTLAYFNSRTVWWAALLFIVESIGSVHFDCSFGIIFRTG
jgi:hypothetical protein